MWSDIEDELARSNGVLRRSADRRLTGALDRGLRTGRLTRLLPGVYCLTGTERQPEVRLRAAALWAGPGAVLAGLAAAKVSFWPAAPLPHVQVAVPVHRRCSQEWVRMEQRRIPPELRRFEGLVCFTAPALTTVDLVPDLHGDVIDLALRTRATTLDELWDAWRAAPSRSGNRVRRLLLHDSRDHPWSEAERLQHRVLRAAGIEGWKANRWVYCADAGYIVDVLFRAERLVLEVDGWEFHNEREVFESDRRRRNNLVVAGYSVLNFTYRQLVDEPHWMIDCVRAELARAGRRR